MFSDEFAVPITYSTPKLILLGISPKQPHSFAAYGALFAARGRESWFQAVCRYSILSASPKDQFEIKLGQIPSSVLTTRILTLQGLHVGFQFLAAYGRESWFTDTQWYSRVSPHLQGSFETKHAHVGPFLLSKLIFLSIFIFYGLRPRELNFWAYIVTQSLALFQTFILRPNMYIQLNFYYQKLIYFI